MNDFFLVTYSHCFPQSILLDVPKYLFAKRRRRFCAAFLISSVNSQWSWFEWPRLPPASGLPFKIDMSYSSSLRVCSDALCRDERVDQRAFLVHKRAHNLTEDALRQMRVAQQQSAEGLVVPLQNRRRLLGSD